MTPRRGYGFGVAALGAVLAAALAGGVRAQAGGPPAAGGDLKIGIVNLKECLDPTKHEYYQEVESEQKKLAKQLEDELRAKEKVVRDYKDRMEAISDRTSSLYFELYHKLKMAEQDYKLKKELSEFQYLSEASRLRIKVYQNIDVAADAIARSLKLDLVLRVGEPPLEVERETTTLQRLSQQVVLYHDAKLDITPQVLAKLNEEYRKGKEQKPPEKKP